MRIATRLFTPEVAAAAFRQRVLADSFAELGCDVEVLTTTPGAGYAFLTGNSLAAGTWSMEYQK